MIHKIKINGVWFWRLPNGKLTISDNEMREYLSSMDEWLPNQRED